MPPEPRQLPPTPLIRRLLLHALQTRRHADLALPVRLPARQFLPMAVQDDERGQAAAPLLPFHADFGRRGAFEVRERLRPVFVVGVGVADDGVRAVGVGGRLGVAGRAKGDGREVAVGFLRVRLSAEEREPIDGAAFVRVEAQAG